jgi:L-threonylcarbamoyladenylate synthase
VLAPGFVVSLQILTQLSAIDPSVQHHHFQTTREALIPALQVLSEGGVVVYPTETVYGLAVDATNPVAVEKLLRIKRRPSGGAIPILVADVAMAQQQVVLTPEAEHLYEQFLPGPLMVISQAAPQASIDTRLVSELSTMGVRMSSHPFATALVEAYGKPLTATAAAPAGAARPYSPEKLLAQFSDAQRSLVDLLVDAGTLPTTEPSTVIDTTQPVQQIVRAGAGYSEVLPQMVTDSPEATMHYAGQLLQQYAEVRQYGVLCFALQGEMGAGKTHVTKGLATALGVIDPVTSPSYTLMNEYELPDGATFLHLDLWRTPTITLADLGLPERLVPGTVMVIEWPAPVLNELSQYASGLLLDITSPSPTERCIRHLPL